MKFFRPVQKAFVVHVNKHIKHSLRGILLPTLIWWNNENDLLIFKDVSVSKSTTKVFLCSGLFTLINAWAGIIKIKDTT